MSIEQWCENIGPRLGQKLKLLQETYAEKRHKDTLIFEIPLASNWPPKNQDNLKVLEFI